MSSALPFLMSDTYTKEQHRVLALAAVFQAAQLVHMVATTGAGTLDKLGKQYGDALIHATLNIRPHQNPAQNTLLFYHSLADLRVGLHAIERCFEQPYASNQPKQRYPQLKIKQGKHTLTYAMGLLHLSDKIYKNPKFQEHIQNSQQKIIRQLSFFNQDYQHTSILSALAQIYSETASTVKPRIMIKGTAKAFNSPHEVNYIRAFLFAGLQAAHYWRELAGSPWQLIFSKGKILKEVKYFAQVQHQNAQAV